jgi:hypothetical protein
MCVSIRTSRTHYKDPAASVCKSQDCGNIQKPACTKGKMRIMRQWQQWSHLRMWRLLRTGQNICQAPWALDRKYMCTIKVFNQSIIQSEKEANVTFNDCYRIEGHVEHSQMRQTRHPSHADQSVVGHRQLQRFFFINKSKYTIIFHVYFLTNKLCSSVRLRSALVSCMQLPY